MMNGWQIIQMVFETHKDFFHLKSFDPSFMRGALSRADVLTQIRPPLAQFAINIRVWCAQLGNNQKSKIYLVHNAAENFF